MARYSTSFKTTGAGSATLPIASLYAAAAVRYELVEIVVTNTTAVALELVIVRLSTTGTQGAAQVETKFDPDSAAASSTAFNTHTVAPTLGDEIDSAQIGAAIGAGAVFPFDERKIRVSPGTGNGIGILPVGTGQICRVKFIFDE